MSILSRIAVPVLVATFTLPLTSQNHEGETFAIHVDEIDRVGHTCVIEASTEKITYKLMGRNIGACAGLAAGNEYKASRTILRNDPKDETDESAILTILLNAEKQHKTNAVFDIVTEKIVRLKSCNSDDPSGLYSTEGCQPLPTQKSK